LNQTYLFKQRHGGGNTYLQVYDRPETSFGFGDSTFDTSKKLSIGGGYTRPINGYEFEILAYDRALNTTEEQGLREYFYKRWFLLNTPQAYQVFQRSTPTTGTIKIAGWSNITGAIEASFNGGPYKTIVNNTLPGPFSGTLTEQAIGVGDLTVRSKAAPTITSVVHNVGIGDVFIAAGQSNPSGRGANKQTFTASGGLIGSMFCNDYVWQPLRDFVDSNFNQVDAVSNENISGLQDNYGSMWPLVGTHYLSAKGVCFAVIPCALGSTSITQHLPGSNHQDRSTLYGSLVYRALQAGGVKAVIWWQGETDMAAGMAQANYSAHLHTLADALFADLGVPLIPCKLQHIDSRATEAQQNAINNAITGAWGTGHILTGPNLNSLDCLNAAVSSDGVHITTNAGLTSAANLWSAILETL
jgi:hypothetical protein